MRERREGRIWTWAALAAVTLGTIGVALAQDRVPEPELKGDAAKVKAKAKATAPKGKLIIRPAMPPKGVRANAPDALAKAGAGPGGDVLPEWPYHIQIQIQGADGTPLAGTFYPSRLGPAAPVVLLVHETGPGRSSKDFEEPIGDLKGQGLAEHLQEQGYALLLLDLRGHGDNPRRELTDREWREMVGDLQAAYQFLIDRHNRREINLAKFGVVGLGDGANLVASWAAIPRAAVAIEGRLSDLGALVLVSPAGEAQGLRLAPAVATLAPRLPLMLVAGQDDPISIDPVKTAQPIVERQRLSKVALFATRLHGAKLLRFVPKVPDAILRFLESTIKFRTDEWEPRYNLNPTPYTIGEVVVQDATTPETAPAKAARPAVPAKK